ncbi:hypothetical protein [Nocardia callitridis]|uniref:Transmembrane protein n=1 Tax=Nocardia callitridis TaxID=648753 RepID=A0ABP9KZ70_9NOCA
MVRFTRLSIHDRWSTGYPLWVTIVLAVLVGGFAAVTFGWGITVLGGWGGQSLIVSAGGIGIAVAGVGVAAKFVDLLSEFFPRVMMLTGFPARVCFDIDRGEGVRLLQPTKIVPLVAIMAGLTVYGQSCFWAQRAEDGEEILPGADDPMAALAFGVSVVLLVILVLAVVVARWRIFYELYPSGIVRRNPLPGPRARDRFVAWDDISGVETKSQYVSLYLPAAPMITARLTDSEAPVDNRLFDKDGEFGIPAYLARCDANVLLAIIEYLVHEPGSRRFVADKHAPHWFTTHHHAGVSAPSSLPGDLIDLLSRRLNLPGSRARREATATEQPNYSASSSD